MMSKVGVFLQFFGLGTNPLSHCFGSSFLESSRDQLTYLLGRYLGLIDILVSAKMADFNNLGVDKMLLYSSRIQTTCTSTTKQVNLQQRCSCIFIN